MEQISDHVVRGLSLLIEQYKDKPKLAGLITSYLNRVQELEDAIWEVVGAFLLDSATGVHLNVLGNIVGRGRTSTADDRYLLAIKAQMLINRSDGGMEDLLRLGTLLFPESSNWNIKEYWPQGVFVEFQDDWGTNFTESPSTVASLFKAAAKAGCDLHFLYNTVYADNTGEDDYQGYEFAFTLGDATSGMETSEQQGLNDQQAVGDDRVGGQLVSAIKPG